ncbi:hypothetical protein, partial [Rhizobium sp. J15]|uniref:hypothetical protein n=1 Tax=Rhizobium sp. J15 TaxID=2035450 RepID=UPI001AED1020
MIKRIFVLMVVLFAAKSIVFRKRRTAVPDREIGADCQRRSSRVDRMRPRRSKPFPRLSGNRLRRPGAV